MVSLTRSTAAGAAREARTIRFSRASRCSTSCMTAVEFGWRAGCPPMCHIGMLFLASVMLAGAGPAENPAGQTSIN